MKFYGKCGKSDACHDKRHCNPWRGSRTREAREAMAYEEAAGEMDARELRLIEADAVLVDERAPVDRETMEMCRERLRWELWRP